jgi:hypothetical protein
MSMKKSTPPKRKPQKRLWGVEHTERLPQIKCNKAVHKVLTEFPREQGESFAGWARPILLRAAGRADLIEGEDE